MNIGEFQRRKTHCPRGHEYTEENTYRNSKGRACRICGRERCRQERKRDPKAYHTKMRQWYRQNKSRVKRTGQVRYEKRRAWLNSCKVKCSRCPETHPACLEFHHRNPNDKDFTIAQGIAGVSLKRLKTEIAKCDILCSNCHRKLHYDGQSGNYAKSTKSLDRG